MKYHVFSVYDEKAKAYITPFFLPEVGQATRAFGDMVNDVTHQFGQHPADYTLFKIANWDNESGQTESVRETIANGVELVEEQPKQLKQIIKEIWKILKENNNGS